MKSFDIITKILVYSCDECSKPLKKLIEKAKSATQNAYAPYSGFNVGAAVLLSNGEIVTGCNQENAAYPSGLCAERVAMFSANAMYPDCAVEIIVIAAFHNGDFTANPCCPCGGCRQTMIEQETRFGEVMRIVMYGKDQILEVESAQDLLPLSFSENSLT